MYDADKATNPTCQGECKVVERKKLNVERGSEMRRTCGEALQEA
jgi:hypothetical protein